MEVMINVTTLTIRIDEIEKELLQEYAEDSGITVS